MGVRKVGPPKITKSRLVEEETRAAGPTTVNILCAVRHTRFCAPEARGR